MVYHVLRWFSTNLRLSFFVSSYKIFAHCFARNDFQLFSETSGMMPGSADVEKFFARMTFNDVRCGWTERWRHEHIALQNLRSGFVRPHTWCLRVRGLIFSFCAGISHVNPTRNRASRLDLPTVSVFEWQGGESTPMALITGWQKGRRNDPFRQFYFPTKFDKIPRRR